MSERMFPAVAFVLALFVITGPAKAISTEGLVGYWPLDGDAQDASGNGNHGVINGSVTPVADRFGAANTAMNFPGTTSDYIDLGQPPMLLIKGAMSIAAWVRADTLAQSGRIIAKQGPSSGRSWGLNLETTGFARFDIGINPTDRIRADSAPLSFGPQEWFHLAGIFRPGQAVELYVNGQLAKSEPTAITTQWIENGLPVNIGRRPEPGTPWNGDIDEVQMYNVALTADEVKELMSNGALAFPKARSPKPADGALHQDTWVNLSWQPGTFAVSHNVYLGDNFDDVNNGAGDTFRGNQTALFYVAGFPGFAYPNGLAPGTTYYWRIDEVNDLHPDSPWRGDVWSFTVPPNKAHDPDPPDGAKYVALNVTLAWTPGMNVKLHHVYIGENLADVEGGTSSTYKGPTGTANYAAGPLAKDTVYYWRVDEFDGATTHKGDVWSFGTIPTIAISDPDLMGWWKLDEGHGKTALDWSGHGNDGALQGDPQWTAGYDGGALELDGAGDNVYAASAQVPTAAFTVALWFNPAGTLGASTTRQDLLYWQVGNGRPHLTFNRSGNGEIGLWPNIDGDFDGPVTTTRSWAANTWHHVAATFDGTSFRIYVNGTLENTVVHQGTHADASGLLIGCRTTQRNYFTGMIDDVRLYSKALSEQEIGQAMRGDPLVAWNSKPANGSTPYIGDAVPLTWSAGDKAAQHDVYFGTDRAAVDKADASDATGVYRGRQNATTFTPGEGLAWGGGPYYWRIDEINSDGTTSTGRIWTFTVADFILVDDFESYDAGANQIWYTWVDGLGYGSPTTPPYSAGNGTGSAVGDEMTASYTEETNVHGGGQAMPVAYDNNKQGYAKYSEAERTLTPPRDWTADGVAELSLWFRGDPANAPERLYVAIANSAGQPAVVYHNDSNAAKTATWTQWIIPLQSFANQGINPTSVNKIAVGLGTRGNITTPGGSGKMYFDDIRLYRASTAP